MLGRARTNLGGRRRGALAAVTAATLAAAIGVGAGPVSAQGGGTSPASDLGASGSSDAAAPSTDKTDFYDSRQDPAARKVLQARGDSAAAHPKAGVKELRASLGTQGVVDIDPLTGTARQVARLDGFLTGASASKPADIALRYVSTHTDVFGLPASDLAGLQLRQDYVDIAGTHHLSWVQKAGAVDVFGNGLKAAVTRDGRLVNVQGSPVHSVASLSASPSLSAVQARARAADDVDGTAAPATAKASSDGVTTTFSDGDQARLVGFQTLGGTRLAWQTVTSPGRGKLFLHVLDATTGRVLYRRDLVQSDGPSGLVHENYPGAARGGSQKVVDLSQNGWLPRNATTLNGRYTHTYSDVNDNNVADPTEEVSPGRRSLRFPFVNTNAAVGGDCTAAFPCSWDPTVPNSWQANRKQNAVQVFYFVSKFHDHLNAAPIGFTRAAGNFDARDGDAVQAQPDDGADTAGGLPDSNHIDNANMGTPPDGIAPTMQMYLFRDPSDPTDPFLASNGGDEADIVYHEYTHGLSNRLVVDANGVSTLGTIQAGSMGEAWSDWYAFDYLVAEGYQRDTRAPGEVLVGRYVSAGQDYIRTEPIDCPVGTTSVLCPGTAGAGPGGYTYGDFGNIIGIPEVHADGEIWGQTLWDLRGSLGSRLSESLVTRAMELAPANPSFLDMRNSILQADQVVNRGRANAQIWSVFAHRGMGWFAGSVDGDDTAPVEDFSRPPAAGTPTGTLTGVVTDDASGTPVAGAVVHFGGHASGFPGDYAATTGPDGSYTISGILVGTYPSVSSAAPGYDREVADVTVTASGATRDWALRRDWAALSGGGSVAATNGDEYADFGCGAAAMIDQAVGNGWSTDRIGGSGATPVTPKVVTVKLPVAVDITTIAIDPTGTCGDGGSASTGPYTVETSADGITFAVAASGLFTPADRGHFSNLTPAAGTGTAVRFVRYTMLDSQVDQVGACPGPFSGCLFIDSRELEVFGTAA
jgi:hypothetical protein